MNVEKPKCCQKCVYKDVCAELDKYVNCIHLINETEK